MSYEYHDFHSIGRPVTLGFSMPMIIWVGLMIIGYYGGYIKPVDLVLK
jgi:hypothetical protein